MILQVKGPFNMNSLFRFQEGVETRWSSPENLTGERGAGGKQNAGRKGSPFFYLPAGEEKTLAQVKEKSGTLRRIWVTISDRGPTMLRGLRLDIYWDGEKKPAVSVPFGDFFGHGLGRVRPFQSALFSSPEGRSFNSTVPMPFKKGMRVVVKNECDYDLSLFFYDINYTIGDRHDDDVLYFHAHFNRENPTTYQRDFELIPKLKGKGRYLGANIGVIIDREKYSTTWWGEGEVKVFIDGDGQFPTLCGTGSEDYVGTGFEIGHYDNLYQGCPIADKENMQFNFYRLHIPDPVFFKKDIRVTIQQMGIWEPNTKELLRKASPKVFRAGPGMVEVDLRELGDDWPVGYFERQDDWSSVAYFYLDTPTNDLPPIISAEKRTEGLYEDPDVKVREDI